MKQERIMETSDMLDEMRLMVEGAIVLFEDDALPLTRLARDSKEFAAGNALNMIGAALYNLGHSSAKCKRRVFSVQRRMNKRKS